MRPSPAIYVVVSTLFAASGVLSQLVGSHPEIPRWCGKAYESGSPSFEPGGETYLPAPSRSQLLYVQVEPRHSIYLSSDKTGTFIVDATLSRYFGSPYKALIGGIPKLQKLLFQITTKGSYLPLVISDVALNSTDNLFKFELALLGKPRLEPYSIVLSGVTLDGLQTFVVETEIFYLPEKSTGSVTKIDKLNGNLLFRGAGTDGKFQTVIPYGFYGNYGGYFAYNGSATAIPTNATVQEYFDQGFNVLHLVTSFLDDGPLLETTAYFDKIGLKFIYDMRGSFMNLTAVSQQVGLVKDYDSFLMYYTADEPDGWQYALNSTTLAYDLITSLDKYHPVSLVLNCQNFYYGDYAAGADIILQDTYPIDVNPTYSIPWDTVCNLTHGDCGCDNCIGSLLDVSNRLDDLSTYQYSLGEWRKPLWSVLQAFYGEGYWPRLPTAEETWVMVLLSFNHGAKGITSWIYSGPSALNAAHGALARVVTVQPVLGFLSGANPHALEKKGSALDVSYWKVGNQIMVVVAQTAYTASPGPVSVTLPVRVKGITKTVWGNISWSLAGNTLHVNGLDALSTSIIILDI